MRVSDGTKILQGVSNMLKNKIGISTLRGIPVKESVDFALNCGFEAIEIQTDYLPCEPEKQDECIEYAQKSGLIVSLHAPCSDINISALNRGIREESIRQVKKAINIAARHKLRVVTFHPGRLSSLRENAEEKWIVMLESVEEISDYAKNKMVYIAVENMEHRSRELLYTIEDFKKFEVLAKNNPYFGVTIDFSHFATNKIYNPELTHLQIPVHNIHLSQCAEDKPHLPLYVNGDIKLDTIIEFLERYKINTTIILELKSIFEKDVYRKSYNVLRNKF